MFEVQDLDFKIIIIFLILNNSYTLKVTITDNLKKKTRSVNMLFPLLLDILNMAVETGL